MQPGSYGFCPAKWLMWLVNVISCLYCISISQTNAKLVFARAQLLVFNPPFSAREIVADILEL